MKVSDAKKFNMVRNRVRELVRHHPEQVEKGQFMRVTGHLIGEMAWLVDEVERLAGKDAPAPDATPGVE